VEAAPDMAANVKLTALNKILDEAREGDFEDRAAGSKCRCGAQVKCTSCGSAPSKCDC